MVLVWEIALACVGGAALTISIIVLVCWARRRRPLPTIKEPLLAPNTGKAPQNPSKSPVVKSSQQIEFILPKTLESPVLIPGTPVQTGNTNDELVLPSLARLQERRRSSLSAPVNMDQLDLSMYGEGAGTDEDVRGLSSVQARGRLCFTVVYDSDHGYLIVNILRALHLLSSFGSKPPDTYVHLFLKPLYETQIPEKGQRTPRHSDGDGDGERPPACTAVVKGSDSPQFDQSFCLPVEGWSGAFTVLVLTMIEYDRFSHRTRIGRVYFPLADLATYLEFQGLPEVWRDLLPEEEELQSRGQILVSLCRQRKSLHISLLELKDISPKGLPDPKCDAAYLYVRLSLVNRDEVLKRRRSRLVHYGACAVINEEFCLDVNEDELDEMALTLAVCCRDGCGRSAVIGKACIGALMYVTGPSLQHWMDAVGMRNHLVEHWHTLQ